MLPISRQDTVRAFNEAGVEWDDVHQHTNPQFFLKQSPGDFQSRRFEAWIEEQLHRIVPRLAMDIDTVGEIGRKPVIHPIIVGKPTVR